MDTARKRTEQKGKTVTIVIPPKQDELGNEAQDETYNDVVGKKFGQTAAEILTAASASAPNKTALPLPNDDDFPPLAAELEPTRTTPSSPLTVGKLFQGTKNDLHE